MNGKDKKIAELQEELRKTKIALFVGVRNTTVLPRGLLLGKSEEEITNMTFATIDEMMGMIDFDRVGKELEKFGKL